MRTLLTAGLLMLMAGPALAEAPTVHFAGHDWLVRTYGGAPGPNEWRAANVSVGPDGLTLAIARDGAHWTAAEVVMLGPPLGFGTYEFAIAGDLAALAPNIVIGLFNFPGSPAIGPAGTNEIDIELTQWGSKDNPHRLNWTVHPALPGTAAAHADARFAATAPVTTHRFVWRPTEIAYASFDGPPEGPPAASWTYAPADPARAIPQRPLVVHVNFWLLDGLPPADGRPAAITLTGFRYTPG